MKDDKLQEIIELLPYSIRYSGEIEELLDYAKEQAERVEELEELVEDYKAINKELHQRGKKVRKQNKRYREALLRLRNDINKQETWYEKNVFVIKTVDDALIDWEALEGKK